MSIKSSEHKRRTSQVTAADVVLTRDMTLTTTCEVFLCNTRNKDQLIKALLVQLKELGFLTYQSEGDADTFIVKRALQEATTLQSMLWLKILTYWSSLSITGTTQKMTFSSTLRRGKSWPKWISGGILCVSKEGMLVIEWIFYMYMLGVVVTTSAIHCKG